MKGESIDPEALDIFVKRMIDWYERNGRKDLPWRNEKDPWKVLIASVLLRKTTAIQVKQVYKDFVTIFPDPSSLARARREDVKMLLTPLGMEHKRTDLLIGLAKILVEEYNGRIPQSIEELIKLPGVGRYSASEILLLAYNNPQPLLDRNMIRVLGRVFNIRSRKRRPHADPYMWEIAEKFVPSDPQLAVKFNFGVLDFAQEVCKARNPKCLDCPLKDICTYYANLKNKRYED